MRGDDKRQAPEKSPSQMQSPSSGAVGPENSTEMYVTEDIGKFEPTEITNANPTETTTPNFLMSPNASRASNMSSPLRAATTSPQRSKPSLPAPKRTLKAAELKESSVAAGASDYPSPMGSAIPHMPGPPGIATTTTTMTPDMIQFIITLTNQMFGAGMATPGDEAVAESRASQCSPDIHQD